ncbi:mannose-6-phosphate isomerase [Annulohypoxylon truncatum]|uniref:mannose-6-phosphate isomerase n=1 Tax=Annulohypoxylon truncatum TaxID=327061 RepID=UPI0020076065|nr:mannose-6-phosphate isomerase [Annulohypoxylon truncatum]KAI1207491.1 mannose-6-phosphate isomerase [Annulohypoxylon truncatum]
MSEQLVFQLSGTCNNYPWGKKGKQSLAAQLCAQTPGIDFHINDDEFYSEMWFGDYPDFPARKLETGELLSEVLKRDQEHLLGNKVVEKFGSELPYLPKILSIAKALPLQLHPNKELATKLHEKDPESFTDPNHKPEIAVALSKFEVFAGFKPLDKIAPLFKLEPLQEFSPEQPDEWTDETLREVTRNLLKSDLETVKRVQTELSKIPKDQLGEEAYILDLLPRLQGQYGPEDAGSLVALLCMNFLVFEPGDAVWIPADGIHAYLAGDIVECMARSNNVLNTGFCPPGDRNNADTFANTLTFKAHSKDDVYLPSQKSEKSKKGKTVVYRPPMSEFDMLKTDLGSGEGEQLTPSEGPGVMIVTSGSGVMYAEGKYHQLKEGFIYFIAPGVPIEWESQQGMQVHMAVV